ncbi:MAG: M23 family metallopeptidase [Candidatus Babeliales bacterium]
MFERLKSVAVIISIILVTFFVTRATWRYFTNSQLPVIVMVGLEQGGYYGRVLACSAKSEGPYKVAQLSMWLDGKEFDFGASKDVGARYFELPIKIDTTNMMNGKHTLEVEAVDASYHHNRKRDAWDFYVDNLQLSAALVAPEYRGEQGRTMHLKIQANKEIEKATFTFLGKPYSFTPTAEGSMLYECFVPVDCEENPNEYMVTVDVQDYVKNNLKLATKIMILPYPFKKQHGFSVGNGKLDQEKEISRGARILEETLERWAKESPRKKLWAGPFEFPIDVQKQTTPFGEIRMTAERGRYLHKGLDLLNRPKCIVWASQHGKVIIKDRFLMTGNTVVIDHGLGVFTLYAHLEDFADIQVGDMIRKGNPVGRLGMTGYASGYHLHWEIRVNNTPVDPLEWTSKVY